MIEKLVGPKWLDQDDVTEAYVNKVEKALSIAWGALRKEASELNVPDMGRHAQEAMEQIERLK